MARDHWVTGCHWVIFGFGSQTQGPLRSEHVERKNEMKEHVKTKRVACAMIVQIIKLSRTV